MVNKTKKLTTNNSKISSNATKKTNTKKLPKLEAEKPLPKLPKSTVKPEPKASVVKTTIAKAAPKKTRKKTVKQSVQASKSTPKLDIVPDPNNRKHDKIFCFINEYIKDKNGTQAAIRAGYSEASANEQATQLLANVSVNKLIEDKLAELFKRNGVDADLIIQSHKKVINTDVSKISRVKVKNCRHCWHPEFDYQFTKFEFKEARKEHDRKEAEKETTNAKYIAQSFDELGGDGYNHNLKPNPNCTECGGEGITRIILGDTLDDLTDDERFAFEGAKFSKDGMEAKVASKSDAIDKLAKHIGFYDKDNQVGITITAKTKEELDAVYVEAQENNKHKDKILDRLERVKKIGV